jgi:hypothetical protein
MKWALAVAFTALVSGAAAQQTASTPGHPDPLGWDPAGAAAYLDTRMDAWFATGTKLKTGDTQTACVSCHAARPVCARAPGPPEGHARKRSGAPGGEAARRDHAAREHVRHPPGALRIPYSPMLASSNAMTAQEKGTRL